MSLAPISQQRSLTEDTSSRVNHDLERDAAIPTFTNVQPRPWHSEVAVVPRKYLARILGTNPFKTSYFDLFHPIKTTKDKVVLVVAVVCAIAAGVPLPIIGVIFGHIINTFPPSKSQLATSIGELLGVGGAYFVVTAAYSICWGLTGERISRHIREALVERLLGLDQTYFDVQDPNVTNLLTEKIEVIQMGTSEKVGIFIQSISYFVAAFIVGFILNAKLTGILFAAVVPLMTIIVMVGSHWVSKYSKKASEYAESASKVAESAISAVKVVQAFGMAPTLTNEHMKLLHSSASYALRKSAAAAVMLGAVYFTAYAANGLAFYEGSRIAKEDGGSKAGTVYAVVFLILDASFVVGQFGPFLGAFATAAAAGEKITEVLEHETPDIDVYASDGATADDQTMRGDIEFHEASFSYPSRLDAPATDSLSLSLRGGTMNAIVGESGSGKSTLVSLLLRLYDVSSGRVTIGGQDLSSFNVSSFRSQVALVDQEPSLFSGSILENISYGLGSEELTEEERLARCAEAVKLANVNFLDNLPNGIHTLIGQGGSTQLSGGQKQRICLARALVRRPALLLLDEPTSALDSPSEQMVMKAIRGLSSLGCTVIMVTHRLSTVVGFRSITLMAAGKIVEQGSHAELMAQNGAYKAMIQAQGIGEHAEAPSLLPDQDVVEMDLPSDAEMSSNDQSGPDSKPSEKNKMSVRTMIKRCVVLSKSHWPILMVGLVLAIISGGIILGEAIIFGNLVQLLNKDSNNSNYYSRANLFCLLFLILAIIALISYSGSGSSFGAVASHFIAKVQHLSLANILRQDISWFSGKSVTGLTTSLHSDAGQLSCLSGVALGTIFTVATSVFGGIILAHVVAWKIAVVLLSAVPVMVAAGYIRLRVLSLSESRHRSAYNDAAAIAAEACRSMRTVASLGRERAVLQEYKDAMEKPYRSGLRFTMISNTLLAFSFSITYFVYALAYWWGATQVREGHYSELDFFIVLPALLFSAQSAGQVFSLSPEISRASSAARNVFALHDQKPTIMDAEAPPSVSTSSSDTMLTLDSTNSEKIEKSFNGSGGGVELDSVSLKYAAKVEHSALDGVSLSIKPGEFVALVGPSGAGKSSIVALLQRFYDPTNGRVLVDGKDIRNIPVNEYRARLGLVPQEPDLFPGSITYNIKLGAAPGQRVSDEDVQLICEKCGIHNFIVSLPEGYNTECGTNGSKLSGGQKQRVAIARALVRQPEILLLDEYTSALDAHSEQDVKDAVAGAAKGRTTIVVAHRLSTVQDADRIFVFDHGKLVETGTHSELATVKGGMYRSMVKAQTLT